MSDDVAAVRRLFAAVEDRDLPNPPVLTCAELQPNRDYYTLFTTSAGLYRYDINDVIRVVDFYHDIPLIEFVRKGRGMTSLTGEKLVEPYEAALRLLTVSTILVAATLVATRVL